MIENPSNKFAIDQATTPLDEDIRKANVVLCEAFNWKGFYEFALDNNKDLVPEVLLAHLKAGIVGGEVYFAHSDSESNNIIGVAVWFGPGQNCFGSPEERTASGWDSLMSKLSERSRSWWTYFLNEYDQFIDNSLGTGVKHKSYHLQLIGVHPDYQRKGIARAMMELVEAKARSNDRICVLETSSVYSANVLYKGLGYEIRGQSKPFKDSDGKPSFEFYVLSKP